jgi:hypothetical protein
MALITPSAKRGNPKMPAFAAFGCYQQDQRFLTLLTALRPHGGMLPEDDVRRISFVSQPSFMLGEALIRRDIYALNWRHQRWIPMFQFHMPGLRINTTAAEVVAELSPYLEGFELTEWFTALHPRLDHQSPLELLDAAPTRVRSAARVDQILLAG